MTTIKTLFLFPVLLIGCAPHQFRTSGGIGGDLGLLSGSVQGGDGGISRSMTHESAYAGWEVTSSHPIYLDIGVGVSTLSHLTNDPGSPGFGPEISIRPRYSHLDGVEFFFELTGSWMYFPEKWDPQSTHDGFVISAGPGIAVRSIGNTWITIGFRITHQSNGSRVFGRPVENPGFNADMFYFGWELRF